MKINEEVEHYGKPKAYNLNSFWVSIYTCPSCTGIIMGYPAYTNPGRWGQKYLPEVHPTVLSRLEEHYLECVPDPEAIVL